MRAIAPAEAVRLTTPLADGQHGRVLVFIHGHNCTSDQAQATFEEMIGHIAEPWDPDIQAATEYLCLTWDARSNDTLLPAPISALIGKVVDFASSKRLSALFGHLKTVVGLLGYTDDLDRVSMACRGIMLFLDDIALSGRELHIVAHSMGSQAVMDYLDRVAFMYRTLTTPYFGVQGDRPIQVIKSILANIKTVSLIAPDVPTARFRLAVRHWMRLIWRSGGFWRLSVFSNTNDLAIWTSKTMRLFSNRIGIPADAVAVLNAPPRVTSPDWTIEVVDTRTFSITGHDIYTDKRVLTMIGHATARPPNGLGLHGLQSPSTPMYRYGQPYITRQFVPDT